MGNFNPDGANSCLLFIISLPTQTDYPSSLAIHWLRSHLANEVRPVPYLSIALTQRQDLGNHSF